MSGSDSADQWLSSYGFDLPDERIAQRPVEPRHSARLLAVDPPGEGPAPHARHLSVWDLQQQLQPGDLLVVNDTRVLRARLEARRPSGGAVELLVLEVVDDELLDELLLDVLEVVGGIVLIIHHPSRSCWLLSDQPC